MPELPELDAAVDQLRAHLLGHRLERFDVTAFSVLKTAQPDHASMVGREITEIGRRGKFLLVGAEGRFAVVHLALAGWLRLGQAPAGTPAPTAGPLAVRMVIGDGTALDITEQGRRKSVALWISDRPDELEKIQRLGPESDSIALEEFTDLLDGTSSRLKTVLTDQTVMAGVGNAWSDEILHRARLSPFATASRLDPEQVQALFTALQGVLGDVRTALEGVPLDRVKRTKKSLFAVHGRTGQPCPVCGGTVAEVSYADRSLQYCPACQTGGKRLSDRRMDRLLR